jgi:tRNA (Thr-GGU) A37 N-methylase
MTVDAMAKKKGRSPKNKERQGSGFRTVGIRVSDEYARWLAEVAKFDRVTIAAFLDRAAADRAAAINYPKAPPERIP